ncbi:MAG: exodeoxyribonuclease alpha subunit, partial [Candidatus Binatus sp.]|nr:exodeoxyribonuclease alpha subunit [Candidatus Binatus sp.]
WRRFDAGLDQGQAEFAARIRALEKAVEAANLTPESVHIACELAALQADFDEEDRLAFIMLVLVSMAALQDGSSRFPVVGPIALAPMRRMLRLLAGGQPDHEQADTIASRIESMLRSGGATNVIGYKADDYKPLIYLAPYVYHHRILRAETELANGLTGLLKSRATTSRTSRELQDALNDVFNRPRIVHGEAIRMSNEQRDAVAAAAQTGLIVISGGPGTGKTSIVVAIMRLMVRLGVDAKNIALAAPTGKAAYRIGECVRDALGGIGARDATDQALLDSHPEPQTIHRLLGYSPDTSRFRYHRNKPLTARVVIVDEGSMLDLALMERLTGAIGSDARLILLGDADQLPSVAAGSVFRDLAASAGDAKSPLKGIAARLVENHRMNSGDEYGRAILHAAQAINDGKTKLSSLTVEADRPLIVLRSSTSSIEFKGVELVEATERDQFLDRWYREMVRGEGNQIAEWISHTYVNRESGFDQEDCQRLRSIFAHLGRSRILCVTRMFETGSERINQRLHLRAAQDARVVADATPYVVGEPLLVLKNDYERGLFNGDQGVRLWVRSGEGQQLPMAVFARGDNFIAFRFDALRESVELSYAMTVHKAQGSEFDSVAVMLPDEPLPLLTRELIYTAVSRSRRSVVLIGDETIFDAAIENRVERFSGLLERLTN